MDDKSQLVLDKSQFFLFFWDLSDTIWDFYVRSWDLSDISWDLSDRSWDLSDLCVVQIPKKKKNMGFVLHDLGFVSQVMRTNPNSCRTNPKKQKNIWDLSYMPWDLYYTFWCILYYKSQMFLTYPIFGRTSRLPFPHGFLRRQNNLSSSWCALYV